MDQLETDLDGKNVDNLLNNLLIFDGKFSEKMEFMEHANKLIELAHEDMEMEQEEQYEADETLDFN